MYFPTNELVAISWIKTLPGIPGNGVATTVPEDNSTWAASGFVTVQTVTGQPNMYVPLNNPGIQVLCWGVNENSEKPPWRKANNLAEIIKDGTYNHPQGYGPVTTPSQYHDVRVLSCYLLDEPRRVLADEARFAVYQMDLQMHWVRING